MVVEWLSSAYSPQLQEARIGQALLTGEYSVLFWITISLFVVPTLLLVGQFLTKKYSISIIILSGLFVNLATIGKRYLIVVPSQTHGIYLPYGIGSYSPTWVEYSVVLGMLALAALLYMLFVKVFPIVTVNPVEGEV